MKTIQIDQAGRIVLPKPVRDMLRLVPGDSLKVTIHEGSIRLDPVPSGSGLTRKGSVLVVSGSFSGPISNAAVNELIEKNREDRMTEIFGSTRQK